MPPNAAYQICHNELYMDGNPQLNLASFVTTWMEPEADRLIQESINKNLVDQDEYPQTKEIEHRCVNMLAHLFHAEEAIGTSTIGSSEAIMLAGLSYKWKKKKHPNIVMGADIQVVWDKFARYFEVEPRIIPMTPNQFTLTADKVRETVDENTICVVAVLGTTFTGAYDPIEEINETLLEIKKTKGWDIPLHVDAASGGFVAPFAHPDIQWDFRLSQVQSINVSGHKYGLVYPGVGWVLWRDASCLPKELIFHVNYLGGDLPTFNLNFSRGGANVIAQYYNFLRLGREGYTKIMEGLLDIKKYLANSLKEHFDLLTPKQPSLPLLTLKLKGNPPFTVFDLSHKLRERGWIVPAYTLPPNAQETAVLRIVLREGFSRDMAEILVSDIQQAIRGEEPPRSAKEERVHITC